MEAIGNSRTGTLASVPHIIHRLFGKRQAYNPADLGDIYNPLNESENLGDNTGHT